MPLGLRQHAKSRSLSKLVNSHNSPLLSTCADRSDRNPTPNSGPKFLSDKKDITQREARHCLATPAPWARAKLRSMRQRCKEAWDAVERSNHVIWQSKNGQINNSALDPALMNIVYMVGGCMLGN